MPNVIENISHRRLSAHILLSGISTSTPVAALMECEGLNCGTQAHGEVYGGVVTKERRNDYQGETFQRFEKQLLRKNSIDRWSRPLMKFRCERKREREREKPSIRFRFFFPFSSSSPPPSSFLFLFPTVGRADSHSFAISSKSEASETETILISMQDFGRKRKMHIRLRSGVHPSTSGLRRTSIPPRSPHSPPRRLASFFSVFRFGYRLQIDR